MIVGPAEFYDVAKAERADWGPAMKRQKTMFMEEIKTASMTMDMTDATLVDNATNGGEQK